MARKMPTGIISASLKRSKVPDKLTCQGRRERLQQAPGAFAQPDFGGGLWPNRQKWAGDYGSTAKSGREMITQPRKSEMESADYRSGEHPTLVI